jgi:uncharacterized protein YbaR (Trm112 family)
MMMPTNGLSFTGSTSSGGLKSPILYQQHGFQTGPALRKMPLNHPMLETNMPVDGKLLEILCCPVSKSPLNLLLPQRLEKLNAAIGAGGVQYIDGKPVEQALEEALITEDGKVIYPVEDDIPILLEDKGIGTTQLPDF